MHPEGKIYWWIWLAKIAFLVPHTEELILNIAGLWLLLPLVLSQIEMKQYRFNKWLNDKLPALLLRLLFNSGNMFWKPEWLFFLSKYIYNAISIK